VSRYLWIAAAIFLFSLGEQMLLGDGLLPERRPAPGQEEPLPPPEPDAPEGAALPGASAADPTFTVETGQQVDSSGTAFAIADGVWMTARHVTHACRKLGVLTGPRRGLLAERVYEHSSADVAVIRTERTGPSVPVQLDAGGLKIGDTGFHMGFPGGEPGDAMSSLMGRRRMQLAGAISGVTPVLAWAEVDRQPNFASLGGISGGPAFDARGQVVGVTVASSVRRGRIFTAAPQAMADAVREARVRPRAAAASSAGRGDLRAGRYPRYGDRLREAFSVGMVICRAG